MSFNYSSEYEDWDILKKFLVKQNQFEFIKSCYHNFSFYIAMGGVIGSLFWK